eukprot:1821988-Prymnesium_polylepis.1
MRSFLSGHAITLADAAVWIALRGNAAAVKAITPATPHLLRWWKFVDANAAMAQVAQDYFGVQKDA